MGLRRNPVTTSGAAHKRRTSAIRDWSETIDRAHAARITPVTGVTDFSIAAIWVPQLPSCAPYHASASHDRVLARSCRGRWTCRGAGSRDAGPRGRAIHGVNCRPRARWCQHPERLKPPWSPGTTSRWETQTLCAQVVAPISGQLPRV